MRERRGKRRLRRSAGVLYFRDWREEKSGNSVFSLVCIPDMFLFCAIERQV